MNMTQFIRDCWADAHCGADYDQMCVTSGFPDTLCKELDDYTGYPTPAGMEEARRFISRAENWTNFGWWLYKVWLFGDTLTRSVKGEIQCRLYGHDWVDESWGGPESGGMGAFCKRCDHGWSHTMY